ncbi:hypothetical protein A3F06_03610 [candidate division TM6 bacterium RIFCSPHIGHO2_12_FULL_36_22]|nr:MAG: hypothetical protein A3F06_03610 [candidate division TM6 bacterium RIFCSPHIGHO2_12_FULL_36_22]
MVTNLNILVQTALSQQGDWQLFLIKNWKNIIGNLSQHVRLEKIYDSTIILGVYDTHWMQELYMFSNILLDKINDALEEPKVTHIRFKKVNRPVEQKTSITYTKPSASKPIQLSEKEQKALAALSDPELVQALKRFLVRCHNQKNLWTKKKK